MPYDLCIFDVDGTLTDPKTGIIRSYQYSLSAFGIHEKPENLIQFIGPPLRESFRDYYGLSESDTEKAVARFREYFSKTGLYENTMYPKIPETLQRLKDCGKTLAVATNKLTVSTNIILKHFDLDEYFVFVSGDNPDGSLTKNGKRDIIRNVLDGVDPERKMSAVMIGDREHDIFGAKGNGIDSIGITWGYGSRAELLEAGAKWIADSTDELCRIITKLEGRTNGR